MFMERWQSTTYFATRDPMFPCCCTKCLEQSAKHLLTDDISHGQFIRNLKMFLYVLAYSSEAPLRTFV